MKLYQYSIPLGLTLLFQSPISSAETLWYDFLTMDGHYPNSGLVLDTAGNFYGTTYGGGTYDKGTVYKLSADGRTLKTVYAFNAGNETTLSAKGLVIDQAGNLYGTTHGGGSSGYGTVYKLSPSASATAMWTLTTLFSFRATNGAFPDADLLIDRSGNLYGTTSEGGAYNTGTVFKLSPPAAGKTTWTYTALTQFDNRSLGTNPVSGLALDLAGNVYGAASHGGSAGHGAIFKLSPPAAGKTAWTQTALVNFNRDNGAYPNTGPVMDRAGNLYGTVARGGAYEHGLVFRLSPPALGKTVWTYKPILTFDNSWGSGGVVGLAVNPAGNLYVSGWNGLFNLVPPSPSATTDWSVNWLVANNNCWNYYDAISTPAIDAAGNLYVTAHGGYHQYGAVLRSP